MRRARFLRRCMPAPNICRIFAPSLAPDSAKSRVRSCVTCGASRVAWASFFGSVMAISIRAFRIRIIIRVHHSRFGEDPCRAAGNPPRTRESCPSRHGLDPARHRHPEGRNCSLHVLEREGAERFTTIRVAEAAGVSVGSLYQYFPNKQAILYRLQLDEWEKTGATIDAILGDTAQATRGQRAPDDDARRSSSPLSATRRRSASPSTPRSPATTTRRRRSPFVAGVSASSARSSRRRRRTPPRVSAASPRSSSS